MVFIVGAGPGDPGLITVRGLECLANADVVIYDRLIAPELLDEAPIRAERIYVGKESGHHSWPQDQINDLIAEKAQAGNHVVRLKGGDPFVFGRGGEEAAFLAERQIPFEIVPGVTSAVAVPELAGIPVTHRGIANSFAVATGHPRVSGEDVDFLALFKAAGTLVILMGVARMREIAELLIRGGVDSSTPVAVIEEGTMKGQRITITDLQNAGRECERIKPPAVIVIGRTVSLHSILCPDEK